MSETQAQAGQQTETETTTTDTHKPDFDGEFDAERAKRTIGNLRESEKALKAKVAELAAKAQELDKLKESEKTELQRLTEQLETEKAQRRTIERAALRSRVALAKSLPAELADRLQGETEEEIASDADKLLALVTPPEPGVPRASSRQGASEHSRPLDDDPLLRDLKLKLGIS